MFDGKKTVFEAKANMSNSKIIIFEHSEHIRKKENYFRSEANTLDKKKIIFPAKRTQ